jgi:hypothetical protein
LEIRNDKGKKCGEMNWKQIFRKQDYVALLAGGSPGPKKPEIKRVQSQEI